MSRDNFKPLGEAIMKAIERREQRNNPPSRNAVLNREYRKRRREKEKRK